MRGCALVDCEDIGLAAAVAEEFERGEQQGEDAGGKAAQGQDQREPAESWCEGPDDA